LTREAQQKKLRTNDDMQPFGQLPITGTQLIEAAPAHSWMACSPIRNQPVPNKARAAVRRVSLGLGRG